MIKLYNLRKEKQNNGKVKLIVDIESNIKREDDETSIWISVDEKYSYMLDDVTYDAFLLLPVYMSMYYHTDLYLDGIVSKRLYRNVIDYLQPLLCDYSNDLKMINVNVAGFGEIESKKTVKGTGISCGVDCLSTIYKYYENETDNDYKLTHLFMFNNGWHGNIDNPKTIDLFNQRCKINENVAKKLGLSFVVVDTNLHSFLFNLGDIVSYFYLYTTAFMLQKAMSKYYISSSLAYDEVLEYGINARNKDFSEYGEAIAINLMQNETMRLIGDGFQMTRTEKTTYIADWEIAHQYLNVCCRHSDDEDVDETNCSCCVKCKRTLITLEALEKLNDFSLVFDLKKYAEVRDEVVDWVVRDNKKNVFATDIYRLFENEKKLDLLK